MAVKHLVHQAGRQLDPKHSVLQVDKKQARQPRQRTKELEEITVAHIRVALAITIISKDRHLTSSLRNNSQ